MDLIKSILDDLGLSCPSDASKKESLDLLNRFLLDASKEKPVVIIIDDAQTMTVEGLETLRLLSNLETDKEKLLQLVLAGQEELLDILSKQEIRQLRQRIAISCRLEVLKKPEIQGYISHRLFVAGDKGGIRFTPSAIKKIYRASKGVPRLINKICDYSLMSGYVSSSSVITGYHAARALAELDNNLWTEGKKPFAVLFRPANRQIGMILSALCLLILAAVLISSKISFNTEIPGTDDAQKAAPALLLKPQRNASIQPEQKTEISPPLPADADSAELPEARQAEAPPGPYPFILQLASFKNKSDVLRAVPQYEEKTIPVQWNPVDIGDESLWYRLFTGRFPTVEAAEEFKSEKGITEGIVIKAPWSILIAASQKRDDLTAPCSRLKESGYDCILEVDENSGYKLSTGAFITSEGAVRIAEELTGMGFEAKPVHQ
jgi:cell division septation protein DedD